jgi:hypothetical protein
MFLVSLPSHLRSGRLLFAGCDDGAVVAFHTFPHALDAPDAAATATATAASATTTPPFAQLESTCTVAGRCVGVITRCDRMHSTKQRVTCQRHAHMALTVAHVVTLA